MILRYIKGPYKTKNKAIIFFTKSIVYVHCRAFLEDQDVPHSAMQKIGILYWDFLQNGIQFLDSIIVQLQKQAHFDLNDYLKDPIKIGSCNKQVRSLFFFPCKATSTQCLSSDFFLLSNYFFNSIESELLI